MEIRLPIPEFHEKQEHAFNSSAQELLYGGATRGGKSFFIKGASIEWALAIPGLQIKIFRRHYEDVIANHMQGEHSFPILLGPLINQGLVEVTQTEIRFWNGSRITLGHCSDDRALLKHWGVAVHVLIFEEATQIQERHIRTIRGWVTMSEEMKATIPDHLKGRFPRIIYATNPVGVSGAYFRRGFVKAAPAMTVFTAPDDDGGFTREYVPALVADNPHEDAEATRRRIMGMGNEALSDALLSANWDTAAGDFFREYLETKHVCPTFDPPKHWFKFRTFDWGFAEPFSVSWWAVSDGEQFNTQIMMPNADGIPEKKTVKMWFPLGALIMYREWYGCDPEKPAKGPEMPNIKIAQGIIDRTHEDIRITLTDNLPFQRRGGKTIAEEFWELGVPLTMGDTTRIGGWAQVRSRLSGRDGIPYIYFCESCFYAREYLPMLTYSDTSPEDAVDSGEATHKCFIGSTLVRTPNGSARIDSLMAGDLVIAGDGEARAISAAGMTGKSMEVIQLGFDDGSLVTCTPDHKILSINGWVTGSDALGLACIIGECESKLYQNRFRYFTGKSTSFTDKSAISSGPESACTGQFGKRITEQFQKAFTSIISMAARSIIKSKTLRYFRQANTSLAIGTHRAQRSFAGILRQREPGHQSGMGLRLGLSGIDSSIGSTASECMSVFQRFVSAARVNLFPSPKLSFALAGASRELGLSQRPKQSQGHARTAVKISERPNTNQPQLAVKAARHKYVGKTANCVSLTRIRNADVFCVTEPVTHSFQLANGLVVSNCDEIRLACTAYAIVKHAERELRPEPSNKASTTTPMSLLAQLDRRGSGDGRRARR